jgi:murein DD-endopeptidase MepM/ murein hydrolase activator NlpD
MRYNEFKLSEGIFEPAVKQVQAFLISKGYNLGPTGADGINGPYTKAAIAKFLALQKPDTPAADKPNTDKPSTLAPTTPVDKTQSSSTTLSNGDLMPTKGRISGHYGRTVPGPQGKPVKHPGVDIAAPEGTPIIAPADGKVIFAGWANTAGNMVEILSKDGHKHRFMHMSKIIAKNGSQVSAGDTLGLVGNTGFSRGNHLHWEKYAGTTQLNPLAE